MEERWKPIPGFNGVYEVSDAGNVRSYLKCGPTGHGFLSEPRRLEPWKTHGYPTVSLRHEGHTTKYAVHRLMLTTFIGACPEGKEAAHLNGNRTDNRLSNLTWATAVENASHKRLHGTDNGGERNPGAVLCVEEVKLIRRIYLTGSATQQEIADLIGVSRRTVGSIVKGQTWKEVK